MRLDEWGLGFRTVTVAAGQTTFSVVNDGSYKHVFKIKGSGLKEATKLLAPGKSTTLTVTLQPGRYEVWCPVKGHKKRGMAGEVVVED